MNPNTLQAVNGILALVATLEPAAVQLIQNFLNNNKLQGMTAADIATATDPIYQQIIDTAKAQGAS